MHTKTKGQALVVNKKGHKLNAKIQVEAKVQAPKKPNQKFKTQNQPNQNWIQKPNLKSSIYVCMCAWMHICMSIYILKYTYIYMCVNASMLCICRCVYVYMVPVHIQKFTFLQ